MQYPNHFIDPKRKNKDWHLKMFKAIWDEWENMDIKSFAKGADRYKVNRSYSLGKQSNAEYIKQFLKSANPKFSYTNVKFEILPIIPKFRRITNEKIGKIDLSIKASAVDNLAMKDKRKYEATEASRIKAREDLTKLGVDASVYDTDDPNQPKTSEELTMRMMFDYKHTHAMDIEQRIDAFWGANHINELRPTLRWDLFDKGCAGTKDFFDPGTGEVKARTVDMSNFVSLPCKDEYFRDSNGMGEILYLTIEELRRIAEASGEPMSDDVAEAIASRHRNLYGNPSSWGSGSPYSKGYDSFRIPVLDLEFKSVNRTVYEKRKKPSGNPIIGKTRWKNQFKKDSKFEYYNDDKVVWYKGMWVIDTDFIFNWGMVSDMKRKNSRIWDATSSYHIIAPEMEDMETVAPVEQIIPFVDNIHRAYYKMQNAIIKARPKGLMIEVGALENLALGQGGEVLNPLQIEDLFEQTGNMYYRRVDQSGDISQANPITELSNGIGTEAQEWFNIILNHIQLIKDTLGFNEFTDGSTPNANSLNGVASLAADGTNNAINYLFRAEKNIIERLADSVAVRIHDAIAFKKSTYYDNIFGEAALRSIKEDKDAIHREYGITVEYVADQQEWEDIRNSIEIAQQNKEISLADKYKIKSMTNLKQAQMYLSYVTKRNQEMAQQQAQQQVQMNTQAQVESAQAAEQAKQATIKLEAELKDRNEMVKGEQERETLRLKYELEEKLAVPQNTLKEKEIEAKNTAQSQVPVSQ